MNSARWAPAGAVIACLVWFLLFLPLFAVHVGPMRAYPTGHGLDPSWMAAVASAAARGAAFGSDIVFTGGPLSALYSGAFEPRLAWLVMGLGWLVVVALAVLAASLTAHRGWRTGAALATVLIACVLLKDTMALLPPVLLVLGLAGRAHTAIATRLLALAAGAALALAKFSALPILLLGALLADALAISRRQWPWHLAATAVLITVGFAAAGQSPADLGAHLRGSLEATAGYSAAMSLPGRPLELAAWLLLAGILTLVMIRLAWAEWRRGDRGLPAIAAEGLILAGFLFLSFKAGFVRHDLHSLIGWGGLAVAAALVVGSPAARGDRRAAAVALAVGALALLPGPALVQRSLLPDYTAQPLATLRGAVDTMAAMPQVLGDPAGWKAGAEARLAAARAALKESHPLPALDGPVDMIPSNQSELIANGLDYRPRPTVQEYATYSPALIARNRAFFEGPKAPRHLLMQPGSIDGRHPATAEGALWPLFLSHYEPAERVRDMILLRRRETPVPLPAGPPVAVEAALDQDIALPAGTAPLLMTARIVTTPAGRLMDLLFRPPIVTLTTVDAEGRRAFWRVVPGMLSEGMVISPLVATADDFRDLATGRMDRADWTRPVAIRLSSGILGGIAYEGRVVVTFTALDTAGLAAAAAR